MTRNNIRLVVLAIMMSLTTLSGTRVLANEEEYKAPITKKLGPAKKYNGATPTDLSNGLIFNNGTYGLPNDEYESWSSEKTVAAGMSSKAYPYAAKLRFVTNLEERLTFFDAAIWNWSRSSADTKPEAIEYAKASTETISPKLEKARKALTAAKGANPSDWANVETEARQSFLDLQSTYYSLHRNVR
jgi:hypothetical protein